MTSDRDELSGFFNLVFDAIDGKTKFNDIYIYSNCDCLVSEACISFRKVGHFFAPG